MGLLNRMTADPMKEALQLATDICKNGPIGVQMAKKAIDEGLGKEMSEALEIESQCYERTLKTEDRLEGLRAFKEKRMPQYKGQ